MSCNRTRSIAILLILVTLIACANAHPSDGTEGFENMDFSFLASMGEQFSGMMAHDQFAQMVSTPRDIDRVHSLSSNDKSQATSPMSGPTRNVMPNRSPPRSHPRTQPAPSMVDDHFGSLSPWGMELPDNLGLGIQSMHNQAQSRRSFDMSMQFATPGQGQFGTYRVPNNTAYMRQRGLTVPQRAGSLSVTSAPQPISAVPQQNGFGAIGAPVNPGFMEQTFMQQPSQGFPLGHVAMPNGSMDQFTMYGMPPAGPQQPMMPSMPHSSGFQYGAQPIPTPEILSPDVTNNYNYQPGLNPNHVGMIGWVNRASTAGDRALPRLTTDHLMDNNRLLPPESTSATRSPTSASTTGSSGGRPGSRRRQWPAPSGNLHCHWCSATFSTQGDLTHHLRSHAPYMSRQHVCPHCEKRFQYRKDLARHVPKHDPNRQRYFCPIANCKYHAKGFGRQDHLDRHIGSQHPMQAQREDTPQRARTPSH